MSKIIGNPVGTTLPKSDWNQTDPTKGDYIKNKPDFEGLENRVGAVSELVGDTAVQTQINTAVSGKADKTYVDSQDSTTLDTAKSYTDTKIANLLDNDTEAVDSIMELAEAMKTNEDAIEALTIIAGNKVDKVTGKGLSTNDYTTAEKEKLAGIAAGAEVNVQSDWNATSGDALILNKPTIPTKVSELTNDSGYLTSHQDISGKADKTYVDNKFTNLVGDTPVATQISNAIGNYYTKAQIDALELITVADIDAICGATE